MLPMDMSDPKPDINLTEVEGFLKGTDGITIGFQKTDSLQCWMQTPCKSNGNSILKEIIFFTSGEWALKISDLQVNLQDINISNTFQCNEKGLQCVITACQKVSLCEGVTVKDNIVMSRFHILETLNINGKCFRSLRSKLCNRVILFTAVNKTCIKCQRMTMFTTTDVHVSTTSNMENIKPPDTNKITCKEQIINLIPGATNEMAELILNQAQNACKDPRGRRWSENMISNCLKWYCRSPQSYESFRDSKYLLLTSKSTLIDYKNRVKQQIGFDEEIFDWMLEEAKRNNLPEEGYTGGIIIDEMSIQSDLQICKNGDVIEMSGFMDIGQEGNLCYNMRKGKNEKILGTHALQFVFLGVNGFRFPFAHFISDGIQGPELYPLFWEAVDRLRRFGFKAVYTCMDGAQSNRTFMHINTSAEKSFITNCPCNLDTMVFLMDSKHVIKKIRNNILKSGNFKTSTRLLTLANGESIQWQMFVDCYKWDKSNGLQLHRKLTNDHMFPSNQLKMRNHLAEDVLDTDMLHLMLQYQQSLGEKGSILNGAIELLQNSSKLITIFKDMRPLTSLRDSRLTELLEVGKWFEEWKIGALAQSSIMSKNRQKLIMSLQCHEDIQCCITGFWELCKLLFQEHTKIHITPGLVNSDVIENTFNQQRSTYHGANANPNALQYRQALNSIVLGQNSVSQKANAGKSHSAAEPYHCSMKKSVKRKVEYSTEYQKIKVIRM
jgi:hypothetical protein